MNSASNINESHPRCWRAACAAVVSIVLLTTSCGWEQRLQFNSLDNSATVRVLVPYPLDSSGLAIALQTRDGDRDLYRIRGDVFLFFLEVYWSRDNTKLAVMTCGTPALRIAYDIQSFRNLPFEPFEANMARAIHDNYHLADLKDTKAILDWACTENGRDAFLKRFPHGVNKY